MMVACVEVVQLNSAPACDHPFIVLCYMDICIAPLTEGYSEALSASQAGEKKSLQRETGDIPCSITLRSAGGMSCQSAGPTTAKARFWDREVWDQCPCYHTALLLV